MPWLKSTRKCNGDVFINFERKFNTAEECMDSFTRFEKDSSFGVPSCWPVFWPASDEELKIFQEFLKAARQQKADPTKELAENLLGLVKALTKHLNEGKSDNNLTAEEAKENKMGDTIKANEQAKWPERAIPCPRSTANVVCELSYERKEVSDLIEKLKKAIDADPEAVSAHHKELWRKQAKAMQEYVDALGERIKDLIDIG